MAVTYKRRDDLEKMLEEFASFDKLEQVEFPEKDKKADKTSKEEKK